MNATSAALALVLLFQSQPPSPTPTKETQKQKSESIGDNEKTSTEDSNAKPVSSAIDKLTAEVQSWKSQERAEREKKESSADWWFKWGNLVSAAISAIAALITVLLVGFQSRVLHRQRLAMDKQSDYMRDALTENRKAADAAKLSADTAHISMEFAERANIVVKEPVIASDSDFITKTSYVSVPINNLGRSTALNVFCKGRLSFSIGESANESDIFDWKVPIELGAQMTTGISFRRFQKWMKEESVVMLKQGHGLLGFTLDISYRDIFGKSYEIEVAGVRTGIGWSVDTRSKGVAYETQRKTG